jgi:hypothetical protein
MGEPNTNGGEAPQTDAGAGGGQDITAVLAQVSALQSEIDRLISLVNMVAMKLEE